MMVSDNAWAGALVCEAVPPNHALKNTPLLTPHQCFFIPEEAYNALYGGEGAAEGGGSMTHEALAGARSSPRADFGRARFGLRDGLAVAHPASCSLL